MFIDAATELVERAVPAPDADAFERHVLAAQEKLLAFGLTCVHDMGVSRAGLATLRRLQRDGRLKLRLVEYFNGDATLSEADVSAMQFADARDERLCINGVKLYADGALGSRGAALLAPYSDEAQHSGLTLLSREELQHAVALCAAHGLQPAVHAIGDRANRMVLDVYQEQCASTPSFAALRPRIEHAQVVAPEDWSRFEALGVVASMQPVHATSDMPWAPSRLGATRIEGAYAWRRLASEPARLAFGSDFPVESPDPRAGLYAAITCRAANGLPPDGYRPDQRLSASEALSAFTFGAAHAARQEQRRGRLCVGYAADLTVFDRDPLTCEPVRLLDARVLLTIIDGEVVYRAP